MALRQADRVESNNPNAYGIVRAVEVAGHKSVESLTALYAIPDCILSDTGNNTGNDAIGQKWYVISESAYYSLIDWAQRKSASGWKKDISEADGDHILLTGFEVLGDDQVTEEQLTPIPSDTVNKGIAKLHRAILNNEEVEAAVITKIKESVGLSESLDYTPTNPIISGSTTVSEAIESLANKVENGTVAVSKRVENNLQIKVSGGSTEGTDLYTFNGSEEKTLNFVSGTGIQLAAQQGGNVTISGKIVSSDEAGLMSTEMKTKLDDSISSEVMSNVLDILS